MLNAQFLAIVNLIVYAGAIMVLFLFVVMLMNLNAETEPMKNYRLQLIGVLSGGALLLVIVSAVLKVENNQPVMLVSGDQGLIKTLGNTLFSKFVLPFEISSVLFLSAIIGAMIIAKRDSKINIPKKVGQN
jgi:NADH-quinone oxidoreductase subunit J